MERIIYPEMYRKLTRDNIVERTKVADWLYILDEVNTVRMYLIVGKDKALLFDAGFGFTDFRPLITEVTDLPVTVVCSHGHDDHVLGCVLFDSAYIAKEDYELLMSNDNDEQRGKQIAAIRRKTPDIDSILDKEKYLSGSFENCEFKYVKDGDIFDLGGITLQAYPVPGHTRGSVALYCKEHKALFAGDVMSKNHLLHYGFAADISAEPQYFIRALSRLLTLDIDTLWPAHGEVPAGKELIAETREMLTDWAKNADPERDKVVTPLDAVFGVPGRVSGRYKYKDMSMSYNFSHLEDIREYMRTHDGAME